MSLTSPDVALHGKSVLLLPVLVDPGAVVDQVSGKTSFILENKAGVLVK